MVKNSLVVKSNKLIQARYKLNLNEQKIILYAVSKLDREKENFNVLEMEVKDFTKLIDSSPKRYTEIRGIVRKLRKKEVIIDTEERELITGWLSSIEYIKDTGKIRLKFSDDLIPYLLQLKEQFTKYQLKNILYLKNKYAIRIYELLKQYQSIGERKFELKEFKKMIGCEGKYKDFRNFKRAVLEKSKEELCNKTDICFKYEKIKSGRKVIGIKFTIDSNIDKTKEFIDALYSDDQIEDIKNKSGLGYEKFSKKQIIELYEIAVEKTSISGISPYEYIKLNYFNMCENKGVRNKFAWLKKALEEDYAKAAAQISLDYYVQKTS